MRRSLYSLYFIVLLLTLLSACSSGETADPARTVEQYLQAKVEGDGDTLRRLLCSEMEADYEREVNSFAAVEAQIEDMACTRRDDTSVQCQGQIVALYGTETTSFPLTAYRVVQEDGEWKWCGITG